MTDAEYLLRVLHDIPVEPETIKRSDLMDASVTGARRINLQSRIYAFPEFVLIAEDQGRLCFLTEEAKETSIDRYKHWAGLDDGVPSAGDFG